MNATIKTGIEVSKYLRKYNEYCKKHAQGQRTRQPSTQAAYDELRSLNQGDISKVLPEFCAELRANHKLNW